MYITRQTYKVQVKAFGDEWVDLGDAASMATCKLMRSFLAGADEPLTTRTMFVRSEG